MIKHIFFFIALLSGLHLLAQDVQVAATMDTNKIRIGEQAHVDLYISHKIDKKNLHIQWPRISDTLRKEVDVVNISAIDTTIPDKSKPEWIMEHQRITVTSIDSGFWAIDPFFFVVNKDTSKPLSTEPLLLEVQTIPVDTAEASIKDIKTNFGEPFDWREYLPYAYWCLAALAIVTLVIVLVYKFGKKKEVVVKEVRPKKPPHITALRSLEEIKSKKLWQEGKYKEYHTLISDALRLYIEGRYGVSAMELTSDEIFKVMNSQVIDTLSKERLKQVLTLADYVKFAKVIPIDVENEMSLNNAFEFVNGTKREEIVKEETIEEIKP